MPRFTHAALAGVLSLALAGAAFAQDEVTADTVVATVNGTEITVGHMIVLRARLPQEYQQLPAEVLYDAILDQLINQTLLGATKDTMSKAGWFVVDNEARAVRATEAAADIAETEVTDEAIQAAYDETYGSVAPEKEFNASHILVATEEEAAALVEELNGGADFAELAREKSTGPSGPNGGNLGWFGAGMMVQPFEEAVMALEVGQVSAPVQTQFGWHVIILNETRDKAVPSLDEVRQEITQRLEQEAVQAAIAKLAESAEITRADAAEIDRAIIGDATLLQE